MLIMPPGPFPVQVRLCLTERSWNTYVKAIGYEEVPVPPDLASVTSFEAPEPGHLSMVVHLDNEFLWLSQSDRLGVLVHEAVHLWQGILEHVRESKPGVETEAHSVQWLFMWLFTELQKEGWVR